MDMKLLNSGKCIDLSVLSPFIFVHFLKNESKKRNYKLIKWI